MNERNNQKVSEKESPANLGCCTVEAIVTIDARGQIVLPKETREKADLKAGDKLAVISCESGGQVCCISLVNASDFTETIKGMLGPMMQGMLR
jgi:AbrB family looped-hinge helix DNA binding protein